MTNQASTSNDPNEYLRDRIRYWEGICLNARSSDDYTIIRGLAREIGTYEGVGVRSMEKVRGTVLKKAELRLDTLRGELGMKMMGNRDWRGLKW